MKTILLALAGTALLACPVFAQEQSPLFSRPSQALRSLYNKCSRGPHKTGVDVRDYDACENPADECIMRAPCDDCVIGKKKGFRSWVCDEYVVVAEVRYRWVTKCITKEIPADFDEPVCNSEDCQAGHNVETWVPEASGDCKVYCRSPKCETENVPMKRIDSAPGKTTIKVCYKSCVKVPYTVYRQIKRPICVKQPCTESVDVPITRYEGQRLKCK